MDRYRGARWVTAPDGGQVLLLSAEPASGGRWVYQYSVSPGEVVSLVTTPGPGMPDPADSVLAQIVLDVTRRPP